MPGFAALLQRECSLSAEPGDKVKAIVLPWGSWSMARAEQICLCSPASLV